MRIGIVGGSIIGCYLGYKLALSGNDVTIFERGQTPKDVCSGLVSERIWDFIPKNDILICNTIRKIVTHFKRKDVTVMLHPPDIVFMRNKLNEYVAKYAIRSGCKIEYSRNVTEVDIHSDSSVSMLVDGSRLHYNRVIGCDGAMSMVRHNIGCEDPKFFMGFQTSVSSENANVDFAEVWPTKTGFVWSIPKGNHVEYGILGDVKTVKEEVSPFLNRWNVDMKSFEAALIPASVAGKLADGPVALCGDSAGFTKPWSGGGIIWGMSAANILLKSFPDFETYSRRAGRILRRKSFFSNLEYKMAKSLSFLLPKTVNIDSDWGI